MNYFNINYLFILSLIFSASLLSAEDFILIEAENFENIANWKVENNEGQKVLYARNGDVGDATTKVALSEKGKYHVWASAYEYNKKREIHPRNFEVFVNSQKLQRKGYSSYGCSRWAWTYLGEININSLDAELKLRTCAEGVRIDALAISKDPKFDPNISINKNYKKEFVETFLIEVEEFQFYNNWTKLRCEPPMYMIGDKKSGKLSTLVAFLNSGEYTVFALAADSEKNLSKDCAKIEVSGNPLPKLTGKHGKEGYQWENLGKVTIKDKINLLEISVESGMPRIDSIIFTQDESFDPSKNEESNLHLTNLGLMRNNITRAPYYWFTKYVSKLAPAKTLKDFPRAKSVGISNDVMRVNFTEKKDSSGKIFYERSAQILDNKKWISLGDFSQERAFKIYSEKPKFKEDRNLNYRCIWEGAGGVYQAEFGGKIYEFPSSGLDPFSSGEAVSLDIVDVKKLDANTLSITYSDSSTAKFSLPVKNEPLFKMTITGLADKNGFYSYGFLGLGLTSRDSLKRAQIPPTFIFDRIMKEPYAVSLNLSSQASVVIEGKAGTRQYTYALAADGDKIVFEWSRVGNSNFAFSMMNPDSLNYQCAIFSPLLGAEASKKKEGENIELSFYAYANFDKWEKAYEVFGENSFGISRLREPYKTSLSDTICNLAEYLNDAEACAWFPRNKGRCYVEMANTVAQGAPLAEISVAMLTDDEDYYVKFGLPSAEYLLSRNREYFAFEDDKNCQWWDNTWSDLRVPGRPWGGDCFAALRRLLGNGNANLWLREFYFSEPDKPKGYFLNLPEWSILLNIHLSDPELGLMPKVKASCDAWLSTWEDAPLRENVDMSTSATNFGAYPYWWPLLDLYEISPSENYKKYLSEGAFYSANTMWAHPKHWEEEVTIYKDNIAKGTGSMWHRGPVMYRLGYQESREALKKIIDIPENKMNHYSNWYVVPEKKIKAKIVSKIGLTTETPKTYLIPWGDNSQYILVPTQAPHLLRAGRITGVDFLTKYSRHALIGRYANFPGYYIRDYHDIYQDPSYAFKGPDITTFYWHQVPVHFALCVDYIMAEIEGRSDDKIRFPYVRQQGYMWFTNRVYGNAGKVFDEENCRPLFNKTAVKSDTSDVSVMFAKSPNNLWIILLNDAGNEVTTKLSFDYNSKIMKNVSQSKPISLYDAKGKLIGEISQTDSVKIDAVGMSVIKIPLDTPQAIPTVPEKDLTYHKFEENKEPVLGTLHKFRIRGPFGKDSVYAVFMKGKGKDMKVEFSAKGKTFSQKIITQAYPYEATFYGIPPTEEVEVSYKILN